MLLRLELSTSAGDQTNWHSAAVFFGLLTRSNAPALELLSERAYSVAK
jgi:hypothetical protein